MPVSKTAQRGLKEIIRPFVPLPIYDRVRRIIGLQETRRAKFEGLRSCVPSAVEIIRGLTPDQCRNATFLEHEFIPSLGLNNEALHVQPAELSRYFGRGLHIWQYPNQLADYLVWLSGNAMYVKRYMEIGCRWGGMFVLISEWLRKNGADMQSVVAVDPIDPTPFIDEYFKLLHNEDSSFKPRIDALYIQNVSTSAEVGRVVDKIKPDLVFIDGDHSLRGALFDHLLVRNVARIIVHHDVNSLSCPDTTFLWNALKELERSDFVFFEFIDQYESVQGNYMGIGAMKRKAL